MNPLIPHLQARIREDGPMSLADYMRVCLLHPVHGYYVTRDPLGQAGDFITAPEISQMFGELIGLTLAQAWRDQGGGAFTLAELGPGRGTLMADMVRAMAKVPGMIEAADIVLIEASPHLQKIQAARLDGVGVRWLAGVESLPQGPLYLVANEFFDALPIHQFVYRNGGWSERVVGLRDGALTFGLSPPVDLDLTLDPPPQEGDVMETCPAALPVIGEVAGRIARHGGAALIVDYGGWGGRGDTFQAVARHGFADPLADPGGADLTAHVDFAALAAAASQSGVEVSAPLTQGAMLGALGLHARAARLGAEAEARRLSDPDAMGRLFKALAFWPKDAPPLAPFHPLSQVYDAD